MVACSATRLSLNGRKGGGAAEDDVSYLKGKRSGGACDDGGRQELPTVEEHLDHSVYTVLMR